MTRRRGTWMLVVAGGLSLATGARADPAADACMTAAESAQELRRQGKLLESRPGFDQCSRPSCPTFVRSDCVKWLDQVQQELPSLVFRAVDAEQHDVVDVHVEVDGTPVTERLDGKPVLVDPGTHGVRFVRGTASVEQSVLVRQGEHDRLVTVALGGPVAPEVEGRRGGLPALSWVLGGIGLAATATGVSLWAVGLHERSDLASSCGAQHACQQSQVDSSHTKLVVGDIACGAGLVAIGAAVWIAIRGASSEVGPQVGIAPTPGGATLGVMGRY
jgi:hypothetical protein